MNVHLILERSYETFSRRGNIILGKTVSRSYCQMYVAKSHLKLFKSKILGKGALVRNLNFYKASHFGCSNENF